MKTKKRCIIVASMIILSAAILFVIFTPYLKNGIENVSIKRYLDSDIKNIDNISLVAHCAKVDGQNNSVAGVKEAIRLGADSVVVDICFISDSTPVMSDDFAQADNSPKLENLFKAMNEEKYQKMSVYLNIIQLSDMSKLNRLAVKYNVLDRIYIVGIDKDRYGLITSDDTIIPFFLNFSPTANDTDALNNGTFSIPECIDKYGATGLIVTQADASNSLLSSLADFGIPVIVSKSSSDTQLCKAIINGAQNIYVDDIQRSRKVLDKWTNLMIERNEKSIEHSLDNLSTSK